MIIAGMDDAGRGPVVGPMILAGISIEESDVPKLKELKVKDSKLLTKKQRYDLYDKIIKIAKDHKIVIVYPPEIDNALDSPDLNLNWLEAIKFAEVINYLKPDQAIVDCPSPNIQAYTEYLEALIKHKTKLVCAHHADIDFLPVSAASILAKVTRDREVEKLEKIYGPIGSGYLSNLICQKFLKDNWEKHPEIFRHSWAPYKNYKNNKHQKDLNEF